jgi:methylated-DNA-[protein]-cysteine S-methyltransferase
MLTFGAMQESHLAVDVAGLQAAVPPPPERMRVLMPSALGPLGVELLGVAVSRIVISPAARERKVFIPLAKLKRSDFLDEVFGRLSEYLAGARKQLEIEHDLTSSGLDSFARRVLKETMKVPYGRTKTYQYIAEASGRPEAYRQVLAILQENPIPLLVPCHRIVTNRSGIGSWIGGTRKKRWLLRLEEQAAATA